MLTHDDKVLTVNFSVVSFGYFSPRFTLIRDFSRLLVTRETFTFSEIILFEV